MHDVSFELQGLDLARGDEDTQPRVYARVVSAD